MSLIDSSRVIASDYVEDHRCPALGWEVYNSTIVGLMSVTEGTFGS
jgi:hypothetical protein